MLHKDYDSKGSVEKICGREPQGAWPQDELIGDKAPVVKHPNSEFSSHEEERTLLKAATTQRLVKPEKA
jgi:hypothetical protein